MHALLALTLLTATAAPARDRPDRCLFVAADNIAAGAGNFFVYIQFSDTRHPIQPGDALEYDVYLPAAPPPLNPVLKGGIDADLLNENLPDAARGRPWMRDAGLLDAQKVRQHGDGILDAAKDNWYSRRIDLSPLAGATTARWTIVFEGDPAGRYVQFLDNIRITRDGKTVLSLYDDGDAPKFTIRQSEGYSRVVFVEAVPRQTAFTEARVRELLESVERNYKLHVARDEFNAEMDVARELARSLSDEKLAAEIDAAARSVDEQAFDAGDFDAYFASLHDARHRLGHAHPMMQKFTGHLVGHAHIDLQWLWTWQETLDRIIPETFGQAVRFMRAYPDFTFSQSSPCLYRATEEHHPSLFNDMREMVASGRWELVGGRWCEGDTNMISPESHVRQLLCGQRYFLRMFGRIATVGWEPDTFGHCWTMPQILRKAGIDSYYFCRAGKNVPLFWWEGPDGSRVLAFEEPATGGWYNDVVTDEKVRELARFIGVNGGLDHLMVYGVGNHGGGPTREYIEAALAMKKRGLWPNIKFSTATDFFKALHEQIRTGAVKPPTIKSELNPIFEGCYTSHSRIKKYNRDCETLLESAEVWAALAFVRSRWNDSDRPPFPYPRADFEAMWRDVCWNHHHDTLPGSFINEAAQFSYRMYDALEKRGGRILDDSRGYLAHRGLAPSGEIHVAVFNPLAWGRSDVVETSISLPAATRLTALFDSDGEVPTQVDRAAFGDDHVRLYISFFARGVPAGGYKLFRVGLEPVADGPITPGEFRKYYPAPADRDTIPRVPPHAAAAYHLLTEVPHGMSAWEVGRFDGMPKVLAPAGPVEPRDAGPVVRRTIQTFRTGDSTITSKCVVAPHSGIVIYDTLVDWKYIGDAKSGSKMLKVAFETGLKAESAVFDIPFGDVQRKCDGRENVALKWCAVTGSDDNGRVRTIAVLNDCKHAYDVKDGVIRLTLLRSSYEPDPKPDVGEHHMRYGVLAMDGPLDKAGVVRAAWEFNKPLSAVVVDARDAANAISHDAEEGAPQRRRISMDVPPSEDAKIAKAESVVREREAADKASIPKSEFAVQNEAWSGLSAEPANIIVTALKAAEERDDLIVRAYECAGRQTEATLAFGFEIESVVENDLLERPVSDPPGATVEGGRKVRALFQPYEIRTLRVKLAAR